LPWQPNFFKKQLKFKGEKTALYLTEITYSFSKSENASTVVQLYQPSDMVGSSVRAGRTSAAETESQNLASLPV
jgi:hypothetical protein